MFGNPEQPVLSPALLFRSPESTQASIPIIKAIDPGAWLGVRGRETSTSNTLPNEYNVLQFDSLGLNMNALGLRNTLGST